MSVKKTIFGAIEQTIGVTPKQMKQKSKDTSLVNARTLYVHYASQIFTHAEICEDIGLKSAVSIQHYAKMYERKYRELPLFKMVADRISEIISNTD